MHVLRLTVWLVFALFVSLTLFGPDEENSNSVASNLVTKQDTQTNAETLEESEESQESKKKTPLNGPASVYVIPITEAIGKPNLYILRRGLKEAIENDVDMILLEMDTPGGRVDVTIEMMEMLAKFKGITATYINDDAISAGSFISGSTQEIYFAPTGKIGASAVIMGGGKDVPKTARLKIESYLRANIRAITSKYPYRSDVMRAMLDADFELKIGDEVIKPAGELLTLTAEEAMKTYGDPATPLLGKGIYDSVEDLLDARFGAGNYEIKDFEVTYSERIAKWMDTFAAALLGIGLLMLFLEFKTPGFGIFGILGLTLIAIFFVSQYIAGLAGNEVVILFALGIVLVLLELFLFPGTLIAGISGLVLILGSLLWAMIDFWPGEPIEITADLIAEPLLNLVFGLSIAALGVIIFGRFFKGSFFERMMVLEESVGGGGATAAVLTRGSEDSSEDKEDYPAVGDLGYAVTDLFPTGRIEIDGKRYEARCALGQIRHGSQIRIKKASRSGLIVEEVAE